MAGATAHDGDNTVIKTNSNTRRSFGSSETGESSRTKSPVFEGHGAILNNPKALQASPSNDRKRRSHRSKGTGSFLLADSSYDSRDRHQNTERSGEQLHRKGKHVVRELDGDRSKRRSGFELVHGSSPLGQKGYPRLNGDTVNQTTAGDHSIDRGSESSERTSSLDVDARQIVNLALNLSESRKIVQRRNVSSPLPPTVTTFGDGFAGGSLRQHLQQQRRSSRNMSPKPDRAQTASPKFSHRGIASPGLKPASEEIEQQFHFSPSTLARAEKARTVIELMAQYRRLLEYVPPLAPSNASRVTTVSPPNSQHGSPTSAGLINSRQSQSSGRQYNPLQYIRNRTVRARERKTIDGDAQGFGNVANVRKWVDEIAARAEDDDFHGLDCMPLPSLQGINADSMSSNAPGRPASKKVHRPRVGWMINPADMLADVYWLEQGDNKKSIEDNRWNKIYPQHTKLQSRDGENSDVRESIEPENDSPHSSKLYLNTTLPTRSSTRSDTETGNDFSGSRRRRLHKLGHFRDHDSHGHDHHILPRIGRSRSETSDSESDTRLDRRGRINVSGSPDVATNVLEKQMLEMLAREARESGPNELVDVQGQKTVEVIEASKPQIREELENRRRSGARDTTESPKPVSSSQRSRASILLSDESKQNSNRSSLEAAEVRGRQSVDPLAVEASPHAPAKTSKATEPPKDNDLLPVQSRTSSPSRLNKLMTRRPDSSSKSPKNIKLEPSEADAQLNPLDHASTTPEQIRRRSVSPQKHSLLKRTDESFKSAKSSTTTRRDVEPSGIKGLFKSGRSNVTKLGDMIWKKDSASSVLLASADVSEDDMTSARPSLSQRTSLEAKDNVAQNQRKSLDLPTFTSPFEGRGRQRRMKSNEADPPETPMTARQRHDSLRTNRFELLRPPRIDVQDASPASSPDLVPLRRLSTVSDLSELDRSTTNVRDESNRLNSILGLPGHLSKIPATALTSLDARRPSMIGKRQWSISNGRSISSHRTPTSRREFARTRALLLSSGVKAQEIQRRASEIRDITIPDPDPALGRARDIYSRIAALNRDPKIIIKPLPRAQQHILAARILSNDIQLSSQIWREAAEKFSSSTIGTLLDRVEEVQDLISGRAGLSEMSKKAADEADEVSRDLVEGQTSTVRELSERMERLMRRRRQRFRWVRKGGWVVLEWVLVGVMWWVWALVVLVRSVRGLVGGVVGVGRWLLWL